MTVETGDNDYEPDALVNYGPPMDDDAIGATNPVIIVEVPSVSHYLIVHPTKRSVIHHQRESSGGIATRILSSGEIQLDPPGISVGLEEFHAAG